MLPEPWLAKSISRYPTLCGYVHRLNQRFFGGPVDLDGAIPKTWSEDGAGSKLGPKQESSNKGSLPWKESRLGGPIPATSAGGALLEHTLGSLPILGDYWKKRMIPPTEGSFQINADAPPKDGI